MGSEETSADRALGTGGKAEGNSRFLLLTRHTQHTFSLAPSP
ncbi:MAG: hypothetical protein ACRC2V_06825 [Xenococcaceae cyanobacterium]